MRISGKEETFTKICEEFGKNIERHISDGADNDQRLSNKTQSIDQFSYGISDRGASIRSVTTHTDGWIGRLEDKDGLTDPYKGRCYRENNQGGPGLAHSKSRQLLSS